MVSLQTPSGDYDKKTAPRSRSPQAAEKVGLKVQARPVQPGGSFVNNWQTRGNVRASLQQDWKDPQGDLTAGVLRHSRQGAAYRR